MKRIFIIGGGASGIAAALSAAETAPEAEITILEGLDRIGKKILATGNGHCNLGNEMIAPSCYHTQRADRLQGFLAQMPSEVTVDFFERNGLLCTSDEAGRLYPYCRQASMVLDVLLLALKRKKIHIVCGCKVESISYKKGQFMIKAEHGERFEGDAVILTTGGKAAPKQGITGAGYELAAQFGHHRTALYPCLVPIQCRHNALRGLKGIRVQCETALCADGEQIASELGELQLTEYGVSGIPALQLSCYLGQLRGRELEVSIDFFPKQSEEALLALLQQRAAQYPDEPLETVFLGLVHKRILYALMKEIGMEPLSRTADSIKEKELKRLTAILKGWCLPVEGTLAWDQAQVTGGGIPLKEVEDTFESCYQKGLYLAGELLDVTGICGGYNLHWAWCSGIIAGRCAAKEKEA